MSSELPSRFRAERWYSAPNLWRKLSRCALVASRKTVVTAITLYHCLRDDDTPAWAKSVIVGALGYLILPADLVPDILPGIGYSDDWAVLVTAIGTVAAYVKDAHKLRASVQAENIFGLKGH